MNHYGALARRHWERYLPTRFAALLDPEAFFTDLGEQVEQRVQQLSEEKMGDDPPLSPGTKPDFLAKVGRGNAARMAAQGQALAELVYLTPEIDVDEQEATTISAPTRS